MDLKELQQMGKEIGFFKIEEMDTGKIKLLPEVRQMCSTDKCHMYGRNWSCPPACGTLEKISQVIQEASSFRQKASWKMNLTEKA